MLSWLSCKEYSKRASRALDEKLSLYDSIAYFFHHCMCLACRRFNRQIKVIDVALRHWCDSGCCQHQEGTEEVLSEAAKKRMEDALGQHDRPGH